MTQVKEKSTNTVYNGQVIDGNLWGHQVTQLFIDEKGAENIVLGIGVNKEVFSNLRIGQVIVCTLYGYLSGIIKDNKTNYRLITFP